MPDDFDGYCTTPNAKSKRIRIRQGMPRKKLISTVLHECAHAGAWNLSEEWVDTWSDDVATILDKLIEDGVIA